MFSQTSTKVHGDHITKREGTTDGRPVPFVRLEVDTLEATPDENWVTNELTTKETVPTPVALPLVNTTTVVRGTKAHINEKPSHPKD